MQRSSTATTTATFTQPIDGLDIIEAPELAVTIDFSTAPSSDLHVAPP